ncbi:calcium-binding protein [Pseudanabaena sp. PCC 6802]|uniref:calcium-binding protein n=1 Tax=Pseudanabaena sp. PCC 6802 TaxID=118173 RepID=UPI0003453624|nr:calcium-binding protein [Pseudanabaena sp. PCC 6802]
MAVFTGTNANDSYLATTEGDNARGLRGDDTLIGNVGRDTLNGNADNDLLFADSLTQTAGGNDSLFGGQGADTLVGARFGFSADSLGGNRDADLLVASTNGGNTLFGGQGNDTIYGSVANANTMNGDIGDDVVIAGNGSDRMLGADGNDTLIGGSGNNDMFGESGNDQFQFFTAVPQDLVAFTGAEQVIRSRGGFGGSDTIFDFATGDTISISQLDRNATVTVTTNSAGAAVIAIAGTASDGTPANQTITVVGVTREQLLAPGSQLFAINGSFITTNDTVNTGDNGGTSTFTVGQGQPGANIKGKNLVGAPTPDTFSPIAGVATTANGILLQSTVNDDTLAGNAGNDVMDGGAGNDSINGGDSSDRRTSFFQELNSGKGDTLIGGAGFDTLTGGGFEDYDTFLLNVFEPGGYDTITDFDAFTFTSGVIDVVQISAAAFGGSLVAGQDRSGTAPTSFFFSTNSGSVEGQNADVVGAPIGTSSFYYDTNKGGLYYDQDGAGTAKLFTKIAQIQFAVFPHSFTALNLVIVA